jgi:hypothetical protein
MLHLILDDAHFTKPDTVAALERELAAVKREAVEKRQRASRFLELFGEIGDEAAKGRYVEAKRAADEADEEAKDLQGQLSEARGKVSPKEHLERVHNVRVALNDDDENTRYDARSRVMSAIQAMISFAHFYLKEEVIVTLQAGAHAMRFDRHGKLLAQVGVDFANDDQMIAGLISGGANAAQLERLRIRRGKNSASN